MVNISGVGTEEEKITSGTAVVEDELSNTKWIAAVPDKTNKTPGTTGVLTQLDKLPVV